MATEVTLPRLGQGMDSGKILRWIKAEGDSVAEGEEMYEVETEKVNIEVEAPTSGTILKIAVGEGDEVPIGTVLAFIGEPGEDVSEPETPSSNGSEPAREDSETSDDTQRKSPEKSGDDASQPAPAAAAPARAEEGGSRIKASPLARRKARDAGVAIASLSGSGPDGRIIARDVDSAASRPAAAQPAAAGGERVPLTSMRATIARRLGEAWEAPAFYLTAEYDMERAADMRVELVKAMPDGAVKPTMSDILMRASAVALRRVPDMNVHFAGDAIIKFSEAHIGLAVATDAGLVVPVVRDCHIRTVYEIAEERSRLVTAARNGRLTPQDMEGGTFTISNLGMMGIEQFTAVLNPPMAGILAVGATQDTVVAVNRKMEIRPRMKVTLGCDHRAVDGAVGAQFLQELRRAIEQPLTMV